MRRFDQVDVFTDEPLLGNPVAVVHQADDLPAARMAALARWTNLSETTFLLAPTDPAADYRLRIFTAQSGELPFAGHPTLGSARAWLAAGGRPRRDGVVVQECGAGLVTLRRGEGPAGERLAFAAPPLKRTGPLSSQDVARFCRALRIDAETIVDSQWVDNGPGWAALLLSDDAAVLGIDPDPAAMPGVHVGVVGRRSAGADADADVDVEVRALTSHVSSLEDPVTGSLNAGIAQWLIGTGRLPERYVAAQGTRLGRRGRVYLQRVDGEVWVGGDCVIGVTGTVAL